MIRVPFLMCVLSGKVEKAVAGTPVYGRLVGREDVVGLEEGRENDAR